MYGKVLLGVASMQGKDLLKASLCHKAKPGYISGQAGLSYPPGRLQGREGGGGGAAGGGGEEVSSSSAK